MFQQSKTTSGSSSNPITEGVIWQQLLLFFFPILFLCHFPLFFNKYDFDHAIILNKKISLLYNFIDILQSCYYFITILISYLMN